MVSNKVERDAIAKINSQILELKWRVAALRFTLLLKRYDPNQPRVAAGRPDGGQWTDTGTQSAAINELERRCDEQYARDTFHCTMVGLRSCHAQAMARYGDCLQGRTIRPLSY